MDEIEIIDSTQINQTSFFSKLKVKLQQGYKINVIFRKVFNFGQQNTNDTQNQKSTQYQKQASSPPQSFNCSQRQGPKIQSIQTPQAEPDVKKGIHYNKEQTKEIKIGYQRKQQHIRETRKQQFVQITVQVTQMMELLLKLKSQCKGTHIDYEGLQAQYHQVFEQANNLLQNYKEDLDMLLKKRIWIIVVEAKVQRSFCLKRMHKFMDAALCIQYVVHKFSISEPEIFTKLLLEEAGLYYQSFNFVRALDIYTHCLVLYEKLNWKPQIAYVLCQMGVIFAYFNQFEEAKRLVCEGIEIGKKHMASDDYKFALCYDSFGIVFFQSKDYLLSLESFSNSMTIKKKNAHHLLSKAKTHNFLGQSYLITCVYTKAIEEFKEAIELLGLLNEQHYQTKVMINLGIAYYHMGDVQDSVCMFQQAYLRQKQIFERGHPILKRTLNHLKFIKDHKPKAIKGSIQS